MALVQCYKCEKEISDKAPTCPHCGALKKEPDGQAEGKEVNENPTGDDWAFKAADGLIKGAGCVSALAVGLLILIFLTSC